ncbi:monovalent cation:proton antiporter-2 (CPA2) family protein [Nannocystis sp.]|uniref:monovalent cation:proton antiporter-2 (CPA2) family protein n=1 Tax=Nannocystis sp. TaxID=1962667 RepID=UPI0025FFA059|nr:monovalent cation:proton antiporter-2 (CPA2) family protein [Nannocystis sp.]MBK7826545.1 cation:proton antiporter [Nannocystis sp.]
MQLAQATIFLAAAVVAVPVFKRLGLGAVLGYLAAGVAIGPSGFGFIHEVDSTLHFAELGVVLLMFLVGLELQPARLWQLRAQVFEYGGLQVAVSAVLLAPIVWLLGLPPSAAIVTGLALALSSTAIVLQILADRHSLSTPHGHAAFGILLFQDVAASPLLAVLPLLGTARAAEAAGRSGLAQVGLALGVIVSLVFAGRYLLGPLFRVVAGTRIRELSAALALLIVLATAILVEQVGLSMALGAFLAGVLLADSPYRHQLEADIDPFKGLLLGLFFVAVGMSARLGLLAEQPLTLAGLVLALVAVKLLAVLVLGRLVFKLPRHGALDLAIALSQGGEFAFVVCSAAIAAGVFDRPTADMLILVVTLSMVTTPLLFLLRDRLSRETAADPRPFDTIDEAHGVIIAGFGRFGQIVARVLRMARVGFTALEVSPTQIDFVRRYGSKIFYGDAARLDLLHAAGAHKARLLIVAVDDTEAALHIVQHARQHFPQLRILARSRNRQHNHALVAAGADTVIRETLVSSLELAEQALTELGRADAHELTLAFRRWDERVLAEQFTLRDNEQALIAHAKQSADELERLFETDARV